MNVQDHRRDIIIIIKLVHKYRKTKITQNMFKQIKRLKHPFITYCHLLKCPLVKRFHGPNTHYLLPLGKPTHYGTDFMPYCISNKYSQFLVYIFHIDVLLLLLDCYTYMFSISVCVIIALYHFDHCGYISISIHPSVHPSIHPSMHLFYVKLPSNIKAYRCELYTEGS